MSAMSRVLKPLLQQVMVITGASSGIGLVTARAAAAGGAKVLLVARGEAGLRSAVAGIIAAGGVADYVVADVGDMAQVQAAADTAFARFGRIDTWVNNAGIAIYGRLLDTPLDAHERLFRTNYFGTVHGALAAMPYLTTTRGAFIATGSIACDLPSPILSAYAASKHAVKGFINSLRMELVADGVPVTVTLIKPSGIDTPVAQHAANHVAGEGRIPPPVYDPALVASAILDAAQHVRRDVTVGGLGRLQVLLGTHFPAVLDRLSPALAALAVDTKRPASAANALFAPQPGQERSGVQHGRTTSLYTAAERHPFGVVLGAAVTLAALSMLVTGNGQRPVRPARRTL